MRRIAYAFTMGMAGWLAGCHNAKPQAEPIQTADIDYGSLTPDLYAADSGVAAPYSAGRPIDSAMMSSMPPVTQPLALSAAATRIHTVAKGDTLYGLARQYYGDQSRWRDIYAANRNALSDPNMLRIGQDLTVP